jgi:cbb3-type cytochrome oxidase subunit 3
LLAGPLGVAFAVFVLNALFVGWLWWRLRPAGRSPHRRSDT